MSQYSFTPQDEKHMQRLFFDYLDKEIDLIPNAADPSSVASNFLSLLAKNLSQCYTNNRSEFLDRVLKRKRGEVECQVDRYQKLRRIEREPYSIQFCTEPYLQIVIFSFLDLKDLLMLRASNRYFKAFFENNFNSVLSNYTETFPSKELSCNYLLSLEHVHYKSSSLRKKLVLAGVERLFVDQCIAEQYVHKVVEIGTEDAIFSHAYPIFRSHIGFRIRNITQSSFFSRGKVVLYLIDSKLFIMNPILEHYRIPLPKCECYITIPGIDKGIVQNAINFPSTHTTIMKNCFDEDFLKCPQKKITFFYTCILRKLEINVLDMTMDKEMAAGVRLVLFSFKDTFIVEHNKIICLQRKQQDQLQYRHNHWHLQRASGEIETFNNRNYFNNIGSENMNIFFFKKYYERRPNDKDYTYYLHWLDSLGKLH